MLNALKQTKNNGFYITLTYVNIYFIALFIFF